MTALHVACQSGHVALAMLLFSKGAEVNTPERAGGQTPLHFAAAGGHGQIVSFLIRTGADVMATDHQGWLAEELAAANHHGAVQRLLLTAAREGSLKTPGGRVVLKRIQKEEKEERKEERKLEREERRLREKDEALQVQLAQLNEELGRLEAIPAHVVTKKERQARAHVEQQLAKVDAKHQRYLQEIREMRRDAVEGGEARYQGSAKGHQQSHAKWLGGLLSN